MLDLEIKHNPWVVSVITSKNCNYCSSLMPSIDDCIKNNPDVRIIKFDVDSPESKEILTRFDALHLPYFGVFHRETKTTEDPIFGHFLGGEIGTSEDTLNNIVKIIKSYKNE